MMRQTYQVLFDIDPHSFDVFDNTGDTTCQKIFVEFRLSALHRIGFEDYTTFVTKIATYDVKVITSLTSSSIHENTEKKTHTNKKETTIRIMRIAFHVQ